MSVRVVSQIIQGLPTSDGAGVKLVRSLGSKGPASRVDPFLMLDEFSSDNADDYIAGFPEHPHRGFETVTYMLDGHMLHEDHMGNRGDLTPGSVQWMTAGSGVVHSEMPQQSEGRMRGFQLWLNLPAAEKMQPASYRDIPPTAIPEVALADGGQVKVIAGSMQSAGSPVHGPINAPAHRLTTDPLFLDVALPASGTLTQAVTPGHNALLFVFEGTAVVADQRVQTHQAARLSDGEQVTITAGDDGARFLLLAGKPLNEPVVQYGPFVMNSREEIQQTLSDYARGHLVPADAGDVS